MKRSSHHSRRKVTATTKKVIVPIIVVHGGAGDIPQSRINGKLNGVRLAAKLGYKKLIKTDSAMDAVEEAVRSMELSEYFNAGYGSVLTNTGQVEMDASLMEGKQMNFGCVGTLKDILHPISVSRVILEKAPEGQKFICENGAMNFARQHGVKVLYPSGQLVTDITSKFLENWKTEQCSRCPMFRDRQKKVPGEVGTVGAVAIDSKGNIAVATSTGGISGKMPGRIGDTPLIGAGTYCDNNIAGCSATGHGETIMRACLAHDVIKRIEYLKEDVQTACESACKNMKTYFKGTGGVITIDDSGKVGVAFTANYMAWAHQKESILCSGIRPKDCFKDEVLSSNSDSE